MNVERATPGAPEWPALAAPHMARYLWAAERVAGRRVLDAGSGAGYGSALLRAGAAAEVVGVDVDATAVAAARQRFGGLGISFAVDDCEHLEGVAPGWDVVCCFEVIEHLRRPEDFLATAGRLLGADGILLVSTPERASTPPFVAGRPRNPFHEHEWHRDEFVALLRRHFADVEIRVQVESHSLQARAGAVQALRQGLMLANPLAAFAWRKWPLAPKADRGWTRLEGFAAGSIADYPVVSTGLAAIYGRPLFNVGLCRAPLTQTGGGR
ncbi:MAG: methyltransferase domain-containing protein [Planctomycetia bacterium]|nr:methyltransferase domain-containing protein [Planctomycetia bacterium]